MRNEYETRNSCFDYRTLFKQINKEVSSSFFRYMRRDIWDPIFDQLLNIPSCDSLPNLTDIKNSIKQLSCSFDQYTIQQQLNIANNILSKK